MFAALPAVLYTGTETHNDILYSRIWCACRSHKSYIFCPCAAACIWQTMMSIEEIKCMKKKYVEKNYARARTHSSMHSLGRYTAILYTKINAHCPQYYYYDYYYYPFYMCTQRVFLSSSFFFYINFTAINTIPTTATFLIPRNSHLIYYRPKWISNKFEMKLYDETVHIEYMSKWKCQSEYEFIAHARITLM